MIPTEVARFDALLAPWLEAAHDEEATQRLAQLITAEIEPVVTGVIRFKLRLGAEMPEAEDLKQESLAELLGELHKCRNADNPPIGDLRALTATITYRTCYRWLRRQTPQRNALRNRLQYVLTQKPQLALWPDKLQRWLGGLSAWRGREDCATAAQLQPLRETGALLRWAGRGAGNVAEFSAFLAALFARVGLPIEMDELVRLTGMLLLIRDEATVSTTTEDGGELAGLVAPDDVAWQVEKRIFLQRLWDELLLLPVSQRAALLLNLRDANGQGCIALFPVAGIAGLPQLAAALELPLEKFAALWSQLPLDDAAIGALLNITRQQVINLRKSARERLARRLKGFF